MVGTGCEGGAEERWVAPCCGEHAGARGGSAATSTVHTSAAGPGQDTVAKQPKGARRRGGTHLCERSARLRRYLGDPRRLPPQQLVGEQSVEDNPNAPHVGGGGPDAPRRDLGCRVTLGALEPVVDRRAVDRLVEQAAVPKVAELDLRDAGPTADLLDQQVLELDVAVEHAVGAVQAVEGVAELADDRARHRLRERAVPHEQLLAVAARREAQHERRLSPAEVEAVVANNVWVDASLEQQRLALECPHHPLPLHQRLQPRQLTGGLIAVRISCNVDARRAAAPDLCVQHDGVAEARTVLVHEFRRPRCGRHHLHAGARGKTHEGLDLGHGRLRRRLKKGHVNDVTYIPD